MISGAGKILLCRPPLRPTRFLSRCNPFLGFQCGYCLSESVHHLPLVLILARALLVGAGKTPQPPVCFGDCAYHLGMSKISSALPADRMKADAMLRGVPENEDDEDDEEEPRDDEEEGDEDEEGDDRGEGYSE